MNLKILKTLKESKGYISGEMISNQLGISREAVWKSISLLRKYGYEIEAKKGKGYMLKKVSDLLLPWEIQDGLETRFIGKKIIHRMSINSTQDLALKFLEEGIIIIAEEQSKGRGRMGRRWYAPRGGIWFSLILKPSFEPYKATLLSLAVGLAVSDSLIRLGLDARLKWPNDVMVNNKKIAGILLEMSSEQDKINYIVIGIGINANIDTSRLEVDATSIRDELKREIDRVAFMRDLLKAIEDRYIEDEDKILEDYRARCITLNKRVKVKTFDDEYEGDAIEIDRDGSLIVILDNNTTRRVFAGDVSIRNN